MSRTRIFADFNTLTSAPVGLAKYLQEDGQPALHEGERVVLYDADGLVRLTKPSRKQPRKQKMMLATVDAIEPIHAKTRGRPRRQPHKVHADKGYDYRHLHLAFLQLGCALISLRFLG